MKQPRECYTVAVWKGCLKGYKFVIYKFAQILLIVFMVLAGITILGCETDDDEAKGLSYTEDVGEPCTFFCEDPWCMQTALPICGAAICVGEPSKEYCTIYCFNDGECPDGYVCTHNCQFDKTDQGFCVNTDDYGLLQELEYCPE